MSITSRKDPQDTLGVPSAVPSSAQVAETETPLGTEVAEAIEFQRIELHRLRDEIAYLREENERLMDLADERLRGLLRESQQLRDEAENASAKTDEDLKAELDALRQELSRMIARL